MSCHDGTGPSAGTLAARNSVATDRVRVVLIGNPNVGKSTLFNALTGARQRTMNAPGTTVHWEVGQWRLPADGAGDGAGPPGAGVRGGARAGAGAADEVRLVDLPGTQSLVAMSPDEQVTTEALTGEILDGLPDLAVLVADATALTRSLYLLAQVAETGVPVVVAVTMNDVARARGIETDIDLARDLLGVPVVEVDPRLRTGLGDLAAAVRIGLAEHPRPRVLSTQDTGPADAEVLGEVAAHDGAPPVDVAADHAPSGAAFVAHLRRSADEHFEWVADVDSRLHPTTVHRATWSDRIDRTLLNPWLGVPVFLGVMWLVFQLTTTIAAPLQNAIDTLVTGYLGSGVTPLLGLVGLDESWLNGFLVDGVLAGVATVATFIPPMGIMFLALSVLEDSGYIARAGFVADRVMRVLGLDGRAFLPLVIGFGCNLPALAATRTLPNSRQRLLTGLLVPLSSCTARLTVFVVMATIFFPGNAGTAIFAMYVTSVALIIAAGLALRRTAFRDVRPEPFVLNLPAYQRPRVVPMLSTVAVRLRDFVVRAGRVIMAALVVMWALMAIPVGGGSFGDTSVEDSLYGATARAITPVFEPAGFADWHTSAALATGFVAKEVVVGALAQSYAVSEPEDPTEPGDLTTQLRATFERTSDGHPGAAAAAFMVFVLAYTPCAATVAEQRRHFGWRPALLAVGVSLVAAWVLAVAVFQIGSLW